MASDCAGRGLKRSKQSVVRWNDLDEQVWIPGAQDEKPRAEQKS